ncbi:integrator complex subunit 9 [Iris pallida]|uniref:Integrator complex subunit 9 n=1 Tax=Iris pallida TaxID=29817 RepID=A0AAX6F5N8_IRIPA|nr:integrator complex subunit 9 [Iris pallida]
MKLTCLSKGAGFHFPASHMLELCGFRVLLECPLDLSALTPFSPLVPPAAADGLIGATPWFKTLKSLHLWDPSLVDAALVSTPAGMLGLPYLTRNRNFSAKIYVPEATARIGRMMMEDIVTMHEEFIQCYGPNEKSVCPEWMKWEELENLPLASRKILMGEEGEELGSWMPLYSASDVKECMQKVQFLKYGEEACFNSTLILKAFSSGLEIGSCNWTINGPRRSVTYLTSSIFKSAHAMDFDYRSLKGNDVVLFSDLSYLDVISMDCDNTRGSTTNNMIEEEDPLPCITSAITGSDASEDEIRNCLTGSTESSEEVEKLSYICSCIMDSLNEGGSVLIPIGRLGIVLLLLEKISQLLESANLKVPIFMISSVAREMLAFTNAAPEWLCKERQEKLFAGEALFGHVELLRKKKLHLFPLLHSPELLTMWQEPCIVFSPHWSLRLGPSVHLLHRWHADCRCLLVLENEVDAEAALLPFKPVAIKVLQCSFLSAINVDSIQPLLDTFQPKLVLFPEDLRSQSSFTTNNKNRKSNKPKYSLLYYAENVTVRVPNLRDNFEAHLDTKLAFHLQPRKLTINHKDMAIARLRGSKILLSNGKYLLVPSEKKQETDLPNREMLLYWGSVDPTRLLSALQEKGINGSLVPTVDENIASSGRDTTTCSTILINTEKEEALIQTRTTETVICSTDEAMVAVICEALSTVCNVI